MIEILTHAAQSVATHAAQHAHLAFWLPAWLQWGGGLPGFFL